jgi:hypothetical protein
VRPSVCPKNVLLLSEPSMTRLLSVPRCPAKLMSPARVSRVTPGVVSTKSMKFLPFTGRLLTARSFTVLDCWERSVSRRGVSASTVTVSSAAATLRGSVSSMTWPMFSSMLLRLSVAKPWSDAEIS